MSLHLHVHRLYVVRYVRLGRRVGSPLNNREVLSPANRRVTIEPLQHVDEGDGQWKEVLVEDKHAGPVETREATGRSACDTLPVVLLRCPAKY